MATPNKARVSGIARIPLLGPMLVGHWALRLVAIAILLAVVAGIAALCWDGYERLKLGGERIDRVDIALKQDRPGRESAYCRRQFGQNQEYQICYTLERSGYAAFAQAWPRAKQVGTWREQMIGCLLTARREAGVSWAIASKCSESDAPGPDARN
jgi:hypothetical protein